jgi:hypothetical protein
MLIWRLLASELVVSVQELTAAKQDCGCKGAPARQLPLRRKAKHGVGCRQVSAAPARTQGECAKPKFGDRLCRSVLLHLRWRLIPRFPFSHGKAGAPFPPERKRKTARND